RAGGDLDRPISRVFVQDGKVEHAVTSFSRDLVVGLSARSDGFGGAACGAQAELPDDSGIQYERGPLRVCSLEISRGGLLRSPRSFLPCRFTDTRPKNLLALDCRFESPR